jgi:hypothetical protein
MATKRPSFLKRQKELKRTARANEKREARRERKQARSVDSDISMTPDQPVEGPESVE